MHNNPISPAGVMIFLTWQGKFLLILRDDKPEIANPNTWSPPTGGVEQGETFFEAIERELQEELGVVPKIKTLGVSAKGNCFFFAELSDEQKDFIVLGEGQKYDFFSYAELPSIEIKGAFRIYLDKYPEIFRKISEEWWYIPSGSDLGLALWENPKLDN